MTGTFIDVPPVVRQEINSILADVELVRRALSGPAVQPHVRESAKRYLVKIASDTLALAQTL